MEKIPFSFIFMALLAGGFCYLIFRRDRSIFEHSIVLNAPRDRVFSVVSNLRSWSEWLPRVAAVMPSILPSGPVFRFEGPESGKGAVMIANHPSNASVQRWEIIEATEPAAVVVREYVLSSASRHGGPSSESAYPTVHRITIEAGINSTRLH